MLERSAQGWKLCPEDQVQDIFGSGVGDHWRFWQVLPCIPVSTQEGFVPPVKDGSDSSSTSIIGDGEDRTLVLWSRHFLQGMSTDQAPGLINGRLHTCYPGALCHQLLLELGQVFLQAPRNTKGNGVTPEAQMQLRVKF